MSHAVRGGGRLSVPHRSITALPKLARRSVVEALASHELLSVSPHEANTTSCMRTRRQERRLALGSFFGLGRMHRPSPSANTSEPAGLVSDVVVSASRPQHGARWQHALLAIAPERDEELARQRDNPDPPQPGSPGAKTQAIPSREGTLRLPAHPTPGQFHDHASDLA